MKCSRCGRAGHSAKECALPFFCDRKAEAAKRMAEQKAREVKAAEWEAKQEERARKKAEWEARQAERAKKTADWEAKQIARAKKTAEWKARHASNMDVDLESNASTVATMNASIVDEAEVERMVSMDKDVRKFVKVLRDIAKLESASSLDELQKAKVTRKADVELNLETAKGLARVRARDPAPAAPRGSFRGVF